jgi:hypothetical protein
MLIGISRNPHARLEIPVGSASAREDNPFCFSLRNAVLPQDDAVSHIRGGAGSISAISGTATFQLVIYSEKHDRDDPGQGGAVFRI